MKNKNKNKKHFTKTASLRARGQKSTELRSLKLPQHYSLVLQLFLFLELYFKGLFVYGGE